MHTSGTRSTPPCVCVEARWRGGGGGGGGGSRLPPRRAPRGRPSIHVLGTVDGGKGLAGGQRTGGRPHQQVCQVSPHDAPVPGRGLGDHGGARGGAVLQWAWPDNGVRQAWAGKGGYGLLLVGRRGQCNK